MQLDPLACRRHGSFESHPAHSWLIRYFSCFYITRPALALDALQNLDDGLVATATPPDPRTGTTVVTLDPFKWIHRITAHIPDPGRHCQRFYGAYSNRGRIANSRAQTEAAQAAQTPGEPGQFRGGQGGTEHVGCLIRKIIRGRPSGLRLRRPHAHCLLCYRSAHDRSYPPPPRERALQGEGPLRTASSAGRPCPRFPLIIGPALTHARSASGRSRCAWPPGRPRPANAPPCSSFCRFPSAFPNRNTYKLFRLLNAGDLQV
jgi:Putative transposase